MLWNTNWLLWLAVGYLAGSVPFGLLIGWSRGVDIRRQGSGNIGATNVGRVLGRPWGVACFLLDLAKGFAPVWLYGCWAGLISGQTQGAAAALSWLAIAAAAIVGHIFPLWLGFRGGKGVATGLGALLGLWPVLTLSGAAAAVGWIIAILISGYVSVASIAAAVLLPPLAILSAALLGRPVDEIAVYAGVTVLLAALVVLRHRGNIARLRAGTEPKALWAARRS